MMWFRSVSMGSPGLRWQRSLNRTNPVIMGCPRSTTVELGRTIKNYRTSACGHCGLKPRCTRNKDGRKITRWVDEHLLEEMEQRLRRAPALFAQRKALSEHPFGTMKRSMDQGYFLLKGLRKVRGEFSLTVLAYNLKRVLNIVGMPRLR